MDGSENTISLIVLSIVGLPKHENVNFLMMLAKKYTWSFFF